MKAFTLIVTLCAGVIGISSTTIHPAAFEKEYDEWFPIEKVKEPSGLLFIQNDSYFPLIVTYKPAGSTTTVTSTLPGGWGSTAGAPLIIEDTSKIIGTISIRPGSTKIEALKKFAASIPWLSTVSSLSSTVLPSSVSLLSGYINKIAATTIDINPRDYTSETILVFYWPLGIAAAQYPPVVIPLENVDAFAAWEKLKDKLSKLIKTGEYGMKKAFNITKDLVADAMKKPVNDQAIMVRAKEADAFIHAQQLAPFEVKEEYLPQE